MASPVLKNATDSYVSEKYPTKNYSNVNRIFLADNSAADTRYGYLYFGVPSGMAKTTIISAKVKLYSGAGFSGSVTLSLHRLAAKFTGTKVNWNNKPATTGGAISVTKTGSTLNRMWEFDVTSIMQAIANGAPWYGFRISATNSTAKWIHSAQAVSAYRPTLEIVWSDAPDTPKVLIPDNDEVVSVAKPTLQWDFTDPSGDTTMQALNVRLYSTEDLANVGAVGDLADVTVASNIPQLDLDDVGLGAASDVMVNGSVDANANGYSAFSNCTVARDTVTMRTGAGSLKQTATTTGAVLALGAYTAGNRVSVLPGQIVTFESWVKASAGTPQAALIAYFYDASMNPTGNYVGTAVNPTTSGWTQASAGGEAPDGSAYAVVGFYSPSVTASEALYWDDTTCEKTWDGVGLDQFLWWRVRVQDGAGLWSGWSPVGSFQRKSKGTVTILNPAVAPNDFVTDPTPPFSWSFAGRTQKAYEVFISTPEQPGVYIWRSGITTSTDTAVTPPPGKINENGKVYRLVIRIYDTERRRALPDDTLYVEATRDFTYNLSNTVATVTGLVGTSDLYRSKMTLTFDRSTAPDYFVIYRDGKVIASDVEPSDLLVSGTSYAYVDIDAKPRKTHTWIVAAKVNGVVSSDNPTVTGKVKAVTTTLSLPDGSKTAFLMNPKVAAERAEDSEIHYILGDAPPVLVTQAQRGYEGTISGVLADTTVPGETAEGMLGYMEYFKDNPGLVTRLVWVDKIMSVVIRRVSDVPIPYPDGTVDYLVSFEFFQVDF